MIILGETFRVQSWRDVAYRTAETVAGLVDDFDKLALEMPGYFRKEEFQRASRQLPNGWWIYLNLSSTNVKSFCRDLISIAGISEDDWQVEEE